MELVLTNINKAMLEAYLLANLHTTFTTNGEPVRQIILRQTQLIIPDGMITVHFKWLQILSIASGQILLEDLSNI